MRLELFHYGLGLVLIITGAALSIFLDIPLIGLGFLIIGVLLFLLPSMRRTTRRL